MINVLLICSMGASTAVLCDKIREVAQQQNYDMTIQATPLVGSTEKIDKADLILLGPQVRYMLKKISAQAGEKPVDAIDMLHYGMMDGAKVFDQIKKIASDNNL